MKHNACIITNRKIKTKTVILTSVCIALAVSFIAASNASINGAINGLCLCADILIPSLFPFCVISTFIIRSDISDFLGKLLHPSGKLLFGINGNATCAIILSMLSGYPVGAKLIGLLYEQNQLSQKQAQNLICCCVNPGPAFIVLAVGQGILNNRQMGYLLLAANIISCIIINIIFRSKEPIISQSAVNSLSYSDAFVQSVSDACTSIIGVCAWVVLFSSVLETTGVFLPQHIQNILTALSEITTSTVYLRKNIMLVAISLGWCGFSVHAQIMSVCGKIMPNYLKFALIRLLHGLLLAGITQLLMKIFSVSLAVSSIADTPVYSGTAASVPAAIALIVTCVIFLASCPKNTLGKLNNI